MLMRSFFTQSIKVLIMLGEKRACARSAPIRIIGLLVGQFLISNSVASAKAHSSHTHGVANLTLASENGVLEIRFDSPAVNLVGFEHRPKTQQQIENIDSAKLLLSAGDAVFGFSGAECRSNSVSIQAHGLVGGSDDANHDSHHTYEEHEHNAGHSEISVIYGFGCSVEEKLQSVTFNLFKYFPGLEEIKVNWVTSIQQGETVLGPDNITINLN